MSEVLAQLEKKGGESLDTSTVFSIPPTGSWKLPSGNQTVSGGISQYKYVIGSVLQGATGSVYHWATYVKTIDEFKTSRFYWPGGSGNDIEARYVNETTIYVSSGNNQQWQLTFLK